MPRSFWSLSHTLDVADLSPSAGVFDEQARLFALGGWGEAKVVRTDDASVVWAGRLESEGAAPEDAGVVSLAALSGSGAWALFATDFHTGATGSRGLFLVDLAEGEVAELEVDREESFLAAAFTPDESRVLVATGTKLLSFDCRTKQPATIWLPWSEEAAPTSRGTALVCLSDNTALRASHLHLFEIDLVHGKASLRVAPPPAGGDGPWPGGVATRTPGGGALFAEAARGNDSGSCVWRYQDGALRRIAVVKGDVLRISPDGQSADVLVENGLRRVDLVTGKSRALSWPEEAELDPDVPIGVFAVSGDGMRAAVYEDHGLVEQVFLFSSRDSVSPARAPERGAAPKKAAPEPKKVASPKKAAPAPKKAAPEPKKAASPKKAAPEPKKAASPKPASPKGAAGSAESIDALLAAGRWDEVLALTAAGSKVKKKARCIARALAFEGKGDLWPAAVWAAGACAADKSAPTKAILERIAPKLRDGDSPLDSAMAEVFSLFDEPGALGLTLARLAELSPARRDELAFYAGRTLRADLTPSTEGNKKMRALLEQATRRFATSPAAWFALVGALRKVGDTEAAESAFQKGLACFGKAAPSPTERAFERFAHHVKDNGLSLLGEAALQLCMAHEKKKDFESLARVASDTLRGPGELTPTDRVFMNVQRAGACSELGRAREAVESLREALSTLEREKLPSLFGANPSVLRARLTRLLAGMGDLDGALNVFSTLHRDDADDARRLWEREPLFAGEPRFAVLVAGLTEPPPRKVVESQLAEAKKVMRKSLGEGGELVTLAVAGASLLGDASLLAQALFLHGRIVLASAFAKEGAALAPLERALTLAEDEELRSAIKASLTAARRAYG